jgi:hypothetical protein
VAQFVDGFFGRSDELEMHDPPPNAGVDDLRQEGLVLVASDDERSGAGPVRLRGPVEERRDVAGVVDLVHVSAEADPNIWGVAHLGLLT